MRHPPATRSLTPAQLERVFRRASDLQLRAGTDLEQAIEETEVLRIGEEVGLERRHLRQALAEVQADALLPGLSEEPKLALRLYGSVLVRASRAVPGDPADVERRAADHLRERELLKPVRTRPGRSLWEPAGGLLSTMKRAMDIGGHGYELAKAKGIEVDVRSLEDGWSLVTLTADLRNARTEGAWGAHLAVLFPTMGVAVGLAVALSAGLLTPLIIGGAAVAGTGLATWATGRHLRSRRERMQLVLEGLLDHLERGVPLLEEKSKGHHTTVKRGAKG